MPDITLITYALSQLEAIIFVKWALLMVMSVLLFLAVLRQNRNYVYALKESSVDEMKKSLLQLAKLRGNVVLAIWLLLCFLLIYRDIEKEISLTRNYPTTPAIMSTEEADIENYYPTEELAEKQALPQPASPSYDNVIDQIKSSYEDAIISYMILKVCNRSDEQELEKLTTTMRHTLGKFDAAPETVDNIFTAAKGSYEALYSKAGCSEAYIAPIRKNLDKFIAKLPTR